MPPCHCAQLRGDRESRGSTEWAPNPAKSSCSALRRHVQLPWWKSQSGVSTQLNNMQTLVSKRHLTSLFNYYTSHGQVTQIMGKTREIRENCWGDEMEMERPLQGCSRPAVLMARC